MNRPAEVITGAFMAILAVMFFVSFEKGDSYAYWTTFFCIVLMAVPVLLDRTKKVSLPWPIVLCACTALFLHSLGLTVDLYNTVSWWDKVTHLMSGIVVASLVCLVLLVVLYHSDVIQIPAKWFPFLLLVSVVAFEGAWEIIEFGVDQSMGTVMQHGITDTVDDILTNTVSGLVAGIGAAYYIGKASIHQLVEGMKVEGTVEFLSRYFEK